MASALSAAASVRFGDDDALKAGEMLIDALDLAADEAKRWQTYVNDVRAVQRGDSGGNKRQKTAMETALATAEAKEDAADAAAGVGGSGNVDADVGKDFDFHDGANGGSGGGGGGGVGKKGSKKSKKALPAYPANALLQGRTVDGHVAHRVRTATLL
jgi:hypothetical protein